MNGRRNLIRLDRQPWNDSVDMRIAVESPEGIRPVTITVAVGEPIRPGSAICHTAATLGSDDCQALMDELWRLGVRPANGEGAGAHVESLKYHLEDMRKLVFDKKE